MPTRLIFHGRHPAAESVRNKYQLLRAGALSNRTCSVQIGRRPPPQPSPAALRTRPERQDEEEAAAKVAVRTYCCLCYPAPLNWQDLDHGAGSARACLLIAVPPFPPFISSTTHAERCRVAAPRPQVNKTGAAAKRGNPSSKSRSRSRTPGASAKSLAERVKGGRRKRKPSALDEHPTTGTCVYVSFGLPSRVLA